REPNRQTGYSFSGTGLGLAICRRLVSAMGGELELETNQQSGTRFSFRLDLPPAPTL
ncbi:MAG: ATP-binding protein, partial [Longimicrobiales bacterium]